MNLFQRLTSNFVLGPADSGRAASGMPEEPAEEAEDVTLVERAQAGDMKAYDLLVTRHRGRIYAMIRNMVKNETDAWDLSQEVFIKAWQALPRFEAKARFTTWLYRIAHNAVYDFTRRRRPEGGDEINDELFTRDRIDPAAVATPAESRSPDEAMAGDELRAKIEAALSKLSPEHRECVVLKDVQGLAYKEIADVMECSLGTVMSRLYYARQKLQTLLKDEYDSR
ncbi:sigma-70 family RNA polymerase sigma factor [Luteolibacter flavescens]|uniref:Sigma-70 family RNA polymerase sigma factor n=1 Tax=Luteolibacter flavescens TaxID=1859460 RepID=A0ABT3FW74_9BACT|nr:sigma-70 family RNA polymerase sigma factor [Luteolibacter flavescens]MCW1887829.1 sigma-70 family RNA polymerase sigma factor [Luteolibacter flavescens]